jgi:hypothetical protein
VTGGTLGNFQQSATDPKVWTAIFTPAATGNSATISVASTKFSDAAGNFNADGADANNSVTLATNVSTNGSLSPTSDNAAGIPNDNKTNDNTPELSGKVPAGSAASIVINGQTYPVNVNPDGSWSYTQPAGLPDGTYTPQLIVTPAGSTTPNAPVPITPFTIDTTAPPFPRCSRSRSRIGIACAASRRWAAHRLGCSTSGRRQRSPGRVQTGRRTL